MLLLYNIASCYRNIKSLIDYESIWKYQHPFKFKTWRLLRSPIVFKNSLYYSNLNQAPSNLLSWK